MRYRGAAAERGVPRVAASRPVAPSVSLQFGRIRFASIKYSPWSSEFRVYSELHGLYSL